MLPSYVYTVWPYTWEVWVDWLEWWVNTLGPFNVYTGMCGCDGGGAVGGLGRLGDASVSAAERSHFLALARSFCSLCFVAAVSRGLLL